MVMLYTSLLHHNPLVIMVGKETKRVTEKVERKMC